MEYNTIKKPMSNKKETAVEWLVCYLTEYGFNLKFNKTGINQALKMESKKQQKYDEMLGMLEKIIKENETDTRSWATFLEIKQLIKEAKEL
jgi:hypothetical protein